ncbi:MAG: DUF1579 family protein [Candidatus Korobacteraceae bacterium]
MKRLAMLTMILTSLFAINFTAQAQMEMPKPAAELKQFDVFAGSWVIDVDMKPGPMGPGGKMTETEHCDWMDGSYYLVCHSDFKSSMFNGSSTSYYGYDANDKVYTYNAFSSMGEAENAKGTLDGNTWSWMSESKMGGQTTKNRFILKVLSPTSYSFTFDGSQDGKTWNTVMDGKGTKQK